MKRWALLVVLLYGLMLGLLTLPVVLACGVRHQPVEGWTNQFNLPEIVELFQHWGYWLFLAVMLAGQAVLLLIPVAAAEGRPVSRRRLRGPVIASTFFLANLTFAGLAALICVALPQDKGLEWMMAPAEATKAAVARVPPLDGLLSSLGLGTSSGFPEVVLALGYVALLWMGWGLIFLRYHRAADAQDWSRRALQWLLRGSILELLVAVPCHVVVRQRGDCCAPAATFWGITMGLSVMLMAFGPGVFFLFLDRARQLQPVSPRAK
jgi:hypothetical protein